MELIPRSVSLTVNGSVTEVSPETGIWQRQLIVLTNISSGTQIIYLTTGQDASVGAGIPLKVGSSWCESIDSAFVPSNLRWTAISDVAGATLAVYERVGEI